MAFNLIQTRPRGTGAEKGMGRKKFPSFSSPVPPGWPGLMPVEEAILLRCIFFN